MAGRIIDLGLGRSSLDRWLPAPDGVLHEALAAASELSQDVLGRLAFALRAQPATVALAIRMTTLGRTMFVMCTSSGLSVTSAAGDFADAARRLSELVQTDNAAVEVIGEPSPVEAYAQAGRALHDALPESVRQTLHAASSLLLVLDDFAGSDPFPFELLHDGDGWLATSTVIARFPSIASLVRAAEGTTTPTADHRALVVAVPDVPGYDHLASAADEAIWVRGWLEHRKWDAPAIAAERVDDEFVLRRLPYVRHLHIAAHGEASARDERLLLHGGTTLTASRLSGAYVPRAPTAFVNACALGSARYVGGGTSRGVAESLLSAGSAAVIANLLPVDDSVSKQLAETFYGAAHLGVGEALRAARSALVDAGESPWRWGSTVLFGDPSVRLGTDADADPPVGQELLEAMFRPETDAELSAAARDRAMDQLRAHPDDIHLGACVALLQATSAIPAPSPSHRGAMATACRVAERLGNAQAVAVLAFLLTETYTDADDPEELAAVLDGALTRLEAIEGNGPDLRALTDRALARWMRLARGDRAPVSTVHGATGADADELAMLGDSIADMQLAQEGRALRHGQSLTPRAIVRTPGDVAWNAALGRVQFNVEGVAEAVTLARRYRDEFVMTGALDIETPEDGVECIAGLLQWLWDSQNLVSLAPEIAEGHAGTLRELVRRLADLSPERWADWRRPAQQFEAELERRLGEIAALPYNDTLYSHINALPAQLENEVRAVVTAIDSTRPEDVPVVAAWMLGRLMTRNTFSWMDGSVPEDIYERLERVRFALAQDAEGWFMPLLMEGFAGVRNRPLDELARWQIGS
jgi:hypothetical protein